MKNIKLVINNDLRKEKEKFFIKRELQCILNLYAKMVSNGTWKDYSLYTGNKEISFNIYKRASEKPILRILKNFKPNYKNKDGKMRAMSDPIDGSGADIAVTGAANPIATILSFGMALKYSLDMDKEAQNLENAVQRVLDDGLRTKDIMSKGNKEVTTSQMGDAIISKLK